MQNEMLVRRLLVIGLSATLGLCFALYERPRELAWSTHHAAPVSGSRSATR